MFPYQERRADQTTLTLHHKTKAATIGSYMLVQNPWCDTWFRKHRSFPQMTTKNALIWKVLIWKIIIRAKVGYQLPRNRIDKNSDYFRRSAPLLKSLNRYCHFHYLGYTKPISLRALLFIKRFWSAIEKCIFSVLCKLISMQTTAYL